MDTIFDNAAVNSSLDLLREYCETNRSIDNVQFLYALLSRLNLTSKNDTRETITTELSILSSFDRPTPIKVWGVGLLLVTIISCCAATGIALMPLLSRRNYRRLLIYFIGLGVGSLSGSAVFHLLPQAWGLVGSENQSHDYLNSAWMIIGGIYLFFIVDKLLKLIMEYRKRRKHGKNQALRSLDVQMDGLDDSKITSLAAVPSKEFPDGGLIYSSNTETGVSPESVQLCDHGQGLSPCTGNCQVEKFSEDSLANVGVSTVDVLKEIQRMCSHDHEVHFEKGQSVVATVAWMIIFGDGLHNFIDGLSIGTAFTDSILSGISVSVAVLCEEFPHELGDVAILVSAGMTLRQALLYNLLSAATCYLGFILGVIVGEFAAAQTMIFALAGGMFLYIALGSMAPEMNVTLEKSMNVSLRHGFQILCLQSIGVFSGLILMFIMSRYGPEIQFN